MKRVLWTAGLLLVAALVLWRVSGTGGDDGVSYRLVDVELGDLESVVSSTGTLEPVTTVLVGAQVSGLVESVLVDYNDDVKAGQVVARIDTRLLDATVAAGRASTDRAEAEMRQAEREYARLSALHDESLLSDSEFASAEYSLDVARADLKSARIELERAEQNLGYATITSPIDGVVIERSVDPGQTVQSSFSAPELFEIAGDLTNMQILASVDESDIGRIIEGQDVAFTVQAYPDDTFAGKVRQVRLQSVTEENVVTYSAVVSVDNPDGRLLPGMTATVDFIVDRVADVLTVPNAALRWQPDAEARQAAFERLASARGSEGRPAAPSEGEARGDGPPDDMGVIWSLDDDGDLVPHPVIAGLSDGSSTQITGPDLEEGLFVIAGVASRAAQVANSPFQQNNERRGPPPPGGF